METEGATLVKIHRCLTDQKAKPGPVVIVNSPWADKHGTKHASLIAHTSECTTRGGGSNDA